MVLYRTSVTQTRVYRLPGDERESWEVLWNLLKRFQKKRKVFGVQLKPVGEGEVAITIEVWDDDKHAAPLWREIQHTLEQLREASNE